MPFDGTTTLADPFAGIEFIPAQVARQHRKDFQERMMRNAEMRARILAGQAYWKKVQISHGRPKTQANVINFLDAIRAPKRVIRLTEAVVAMVDKHTVPVTFVYEYFDPDPILSVVSQQKAPLRIAIWEGHRVLHAAKIPWVKRTLWERLRATP